MIRFFMYIENLDFSQWVHNAPTIWAFPMILFVHTLGMSIVAGGSAMLDLMVLGFWPAVPMKPFGRMFPVLYVGFGVNAVTGLMMLMGDATAKMTTPDFYLKMVLVFAGLFVLIRMRRQVFNDPRLDEVPLSGNAKMLAWVSLGCWFGAIIAGRLLAYIKPLVSVASTLL
jgi:hypothetical protein